MKLLVLGSKEYPFGTGDDPTPSGGIERFVDGLISRMDEVRTTVITRRSKFTKNNAIRNHVRILRVPWISFPWLRNVTFNYNAYQLAKRTNPDVVLANGIMSSYFALRLKKIFKRRRKTCRVIGVVHGISCVQPQYPFFLKLFLRRLESKVYGNLDSVVFSYESERDKFGELFGFLPKKHEVIGHGIDPIHVSLKDKEVAKKKLEVEGKRVILFSGRLVKVKGVEYLIKAFTSMKRHDTVLLIAGSGPEFGNLRYLAQRNPRIRFLGYVTRIEELLLASDIFVLPSTSEGLSFSLLEAMGAGLGCIVTDIGQPVIDGKTGLVVPVKDTRALADAMYELCGDVNKCASMGLSARKVVCEQFSWEICVKRYLKLLKKVPSNHKHA